MQDFKQLQVWGKAHEFTIKVYSITKSFPKEEIFGLTSQIRRASVSIAANVAEGCGRGSNLDFCRFLHMAMGSASETEYELMLAFELRYLTKEQFEELTMLIEEIKRMLTSLIKVVKK